AIGRNSPRMAAGASGFMSNVSRGLGPPSQKMRIHDFRRVLGRGRDDSAAWAISAGKKPARSGPREPRRPDCNRLRRLSRLAAGGPMTGSWLWEQSASWGARFATLLAVGIPSRRARGALDGSRVNRDRHIVRRLRLGGLAPPPASQRSQSGMLIENMIL